MAKKRDGNRRGGEMERREERTEERGKERGREGQWLYLESFYETCLRPCD